MSRIFLNFLIALCFVLFSFNRIEMFALPGKFEFELNERTNLYAVPNRGFYNQTKIQLKIDCKPGTKVKLGWLLRLSECVDEFYLNSNQYPDEIFKKIYDQPNVVLLDYNYVQYRKPNLTVYHCEDISSIIDIYSPFITPIITEKTESKLRDMKTFTVANNLLVRKRRDDTSASNTSQPTLVSTTKAVEKWPHYEHNHEAFESITETWQDGAYLFILNTQPVDNKDYSLKVSLSFKYRSGYLAANDWPFLPFFAVMCAVYSVFALFWLVSSCFYWRDLLRLQLWIGGVILLGLMEKAAYLAEYEGINRTGYTIKVAMLVAEIISCFKRSLARMLVIIVSLGFGIVKPRLGPTMQKVVGLGGLYFFLAIVDGVFRIIGRKEDTDNKGILAGVPLVVIDVSICYWILSNLQQTMRTLKVRRNIPKLTLYRHFTNTLIFSVISSVIFMIWSLKRHRFVNCLKDWKELWLDEAFWHILFSFILLVIIILWRPSNNSQRFAFTPLLDNDEDNDIDDEEQETEIFDSVKMRSKTISKENKQEQSNKKSSIEDDLKWVEENVPSTLTEAAIPGMVDSEEELMTTKFEISKMD